MKVLLAYGKAPKNEKEKGSGSNQNLKAFKDQRRIGGLIIVVIG